MPNNLSNSEDSRLPLRFAGMLYDNLSASVCASTGIYTGNDVIRMLLAGADMISFSTVVDI